MAWAGITSADADRRITSELRPHSELHWVLVTPFAVVMVASAVALYVGFRSGDG